MRKKLIVGTVALLLLFTLVASFLWGGPERTDKAGSGSQIAVIYIEGVIMGGRSGSDFLSGATAGSMTVMDQLRKAAEDHTVGAVVLRLNTPGGSVPASQEIAQEITRLKETGKPVIASMGDMSASAGYYLAALADIIVANPATITGSLGVYMQVANYEELYDKLGIEYNYIKSGEHKDMGAPNRKLTPREEEILQGMVNDIYEQFVQVVADGRKLPIERVREVADGRIFTGKQALELDLVDKLGNYYDALDLAAEVAGIPGKPVVKTYYRPSPLELLLGGQTPLTFVWQGVRVNHTSPSLYPGNVGLGGE
ncbi:MAG: signal peptide peptidase SppA [Bacillota bacterium]